MRGPLFFNFSNSAAANLPRTTVARGFFEVQTRQTGTNITVAISHKCALHVGSQYDTFTPAFGDAPGPDEILVILTPQPLAG